MLRAGARKIHGRLAGPYRVTGLRGVRRRRLLQLRSVVPFARRWPITVRSGEIRLRITSDPLDAVIADSVIRRDHASYFPTGTAEPVRLVLDVGAHHGFYTVVAAAEYPHAEIIAVEPSLDALEALRRQIEVNDLRHRVTVIPAAIGGHTGIASLHAGTTGSWGASLYDDAGGSVPVVVLSLRELLGDRVPDIVKSNAEGAEFPLVEQLIEMRVRPSLLVLAVHAEFGDLDDLRARLAGAGYRVEDAYPGDHPVWHCRLR